MRSGSTREVDLSEVMNRILKEFDGFSLAQAMYVLNVVQLNVINCSDMNSYTIVKVEEQINYAPHIVPVPSANF